MDDAGRELQSDRAPLVVRAYGTSGPRLVVIHGGPGAAGYMAPVARELADSFRVLEPLQRTSEGGPLTVQRHVDDLHEAISMYCAGEAPVLIGHSWGAMLALAYAAAYQRAVRGVALVGCGTFDSDSRKSMETVVDQRMTKGLRARLDGLARTAREPDVRMCVLGRLLEPVYSYALMPHRDETEYYDARGQRETWRDMLRLQREGRYPAAFSGVDVPVLMLHGVHDPHPGRSIHETLRAVMPHMEYVELPCCGHYPWWEVHAAGAFYDALRLWLACQVA